MQNPREKSNDTYLRVPDISGPAVRTDYTAHSCELVTFRDFSVLLCYASFRAGYIRPLQRVCGKFPFTNAGMVVGAGLALFGQNSQIFKNKPNLFLVCL